MPVLPAEPDVYPLSLFADRSIPELQARGWWLLHTRPRQEKALARYLHANKLPFYLPLAPRHWKLRGRLVCSHLPIFPGYVFLLADSDERSVAVATGRLAAALPVNEQERLWRDLEQINRLLATGQAISPEDRLEPGKIVEIRSGPLMGLRGKIVQRASRQRFVVEVDFIKRGASILLDEAALVGVD